MENLIEKQREELERKQKELLNLEEEIKALEENLKNIKKYDTICILAENCKIKEYFEIRDKIKNMLNIHSFEELGIKKLAYEIKGNTEGIYLEAEFEGNEETIRDLERYYRKNDTIIKFIIINKDKFDNEI